MLISPFLSKDTGSIAPIQLGPLLSDALLPHRRSEAMANSEVKVAGHYTASDPVVELQGGNGLTL
jgi:hypothetical protein